MQEEMPADSKALQAYVRSVKDNERCRFMAGLDLDLCEVSHLECPFQGGETFSLRSGRKKECKRPRVLRLRKMLGSV